MGSADKVGFKDDNLVVLPRKGQGRENKTQYESVDGGRSQQSKNAFPKPENQNRVQSVGESMSGLSNNNKESNPSREGTSSVISRDMMRTNPRAFQSMRSGDYQTPAKTANPNKNRPV